MNQRREVHYSGRVQGVGFRYTTSRIARGFSVSGFVENLSDGRVRLVVEAEKSELEGFLVAIADALGGNISDVKTDNQVPNGEFSGFRIRT